jgi:hypothetical protein
MISAPRARILRSELAARHGTLTGAWAEGLADVTLASYDPVAVTVLFPA